MGWPIPRFSPDEVTEAGVILVRSADNAPRNWQEYERALRVVGNWRSSHGYPINTFQATLRQKLKSIDSGALVAQRLKRMPSIIQKLRRLDWLELGLMQDIGGLRAVVSSLEKARALEQSYRRSPFKHELVRERDYIKSPKTSGYRSVHLIYRYQNRRAPDYNGLFLELQIRTHLQHAWATAVETMGTFLKHALKSSEGPEEWLDFFSLAGSAFAHLENSPPVAEYRGLGRGDTFAAVVREARRLRVKERLLAFAVAADRVHVDRKSGSYHLIVLDTTEKTVRITSYGRGDLDTASSAYDEADRRGEPIQAVLVSAGPIKDLRAAYPNFYLDTAEFLSQLDLMEGNTSQGSTSEGV